METKRIRLTHLHLDDRDRWHSMCQLVAMRFFDEESLTFKAIYSNSDKLKGFEIYKPYSKSVVGYLDARTYLLYFIEKRSVATIAVDMRSAQFESVATTSVRYGGYGMFG